MIMKRQGRKLSTGETAVMAVLMLCMVLAIAITGIRMNSGKRDDRNDQYVELEGIGETEDLASGKEQTENDSRQTTGELVVNEGVPDKFVNEHPGEQMDLIAVEDQAEVDLETQEEVEETSGAVTDPSSGPKQAPVLNFGAEDRLTWPVSGNVVLDYSMDSTIYFPTLKQYKYNPAIVVSGEAGTAVEAAADGRVLSVSVSEETGTTVKMDLGNGYTAIYGQLKEVPVREGSMVSRNDVIGYISEPTKYYSVEGSNLYFGLNKDGKSVDPLDYLE